MLRGVPDKKRARKGEIENEKSDTCYKSRYDTDL